MIQSREEERQQNQSEVLLNSQSLRAQFCSLYSLKALAYNWTEGSRVRPQEHFLMTRCVYLFYVDPLTSRLLQCSVATWKTDWTGLHMSFARKSYKCILHFQISSLPCCQEYRVVPFDHPDHCVPILNREINIDTYFLSNGYMQILPFTQNYFLI